ncbi:MAG: septal ring lytic transglycosylase RlpA family protein [Chitinophagaceae bacterium]|nr:septal ring lytic transglycosylase RlpA family protein [Chitinophagaceae bacterium]
MKQYCCLLIFTVLLLTSCGRYVTKTGKASYYGNEYDGRKTANGEVFRQSKLTAAHKKLPFGTQVRVTNLSNGKTVDVRINDRGPFVAGRIIDLSRSAAEEIGMVRQGVAKVKIRYKRKKDR